MAFYINIHTHHLSKENDVFVFNNRFGFDNPIHTNTIFSIGIHPWDAFELNSTTVFENYIKHQNCVAIGECGLDKLHKLNFELQKKIFVTQLDLAIKYQKPVIIHCVKAFDELLEIANHYIIKIPLIIHGFNKSFQLLQQLINKGFYVSLHNSVFDKHEYNFSEIPLTKIFLETDNNLLVIKDIYQKAAFSFQLSENELKEKIYINFTTLFNKNGR